MYSSEPCTPPAAAYADRVWLVFRSLGASRSSLRHPGCGVWGNGVHTRGKEAWLVPSWSMRDDELARRFFFIVVVVAGRLFSRSSHARARCWVPLLSEQWNRLQVPTANAAGCCKPSANNEYTIALSVISRQKVYKVQSQDWIDECLKRTGSCIEGGAQGSSHRLVDRTTDCKLFQRLGQPLKIRVWLSQYILNTSRNMCCISNNYGHASLWSSVTAWHGSFLIRYDSTHSSSKYKI